MSEPQPPPMDDMKLQELEMAAARQMMDGKIVKKTRPRRTVDYNGGLGRWALVSPLYVFMLAYSQLIVPVA
jgi:polyadenylation factor subunit 2